MDSTRINLAGGWNLIWDAISGALGGVGGALTVFGTLVVVLGFASWLWQKRRGTGGGQGHSGLLWTMLVGALLVTPGAGDRGCRFGQTSTMVAKAGYVLKRGTIPAERILMLAYNTDAAKELAARVNARLTQAGIPGPRPVAKTFHSFGLSVVGEATDHKPRLAASWKRTTAGNGSRTSSTSCATPAAHSGRRGTCSRMVFGRDLPAFDQEDEPEDWDPVSKNRGYRTFQGELVKSQEERMIANWLFYQGVKYFYEGNYKHKTDDQAHGQYRPDFYYPDIDAYHEHWCP